MLRDTANNKHEDSCRMLAWRWPIVYNAGPASGQWLVFAGDTEY